MSRKSNAEYQSAYRVRKRLTEQAAENGFEPYPVIAFRHPVKGLIVFREDGRQIDLSSP